MDVNLYYHYQVQLIYLGLEESHALNVFLGVSTEDSGSDPALENKKAAIAFIYMNIKVGLIQAPAWQANAHAPWTEDEIYEFLDTTPSSQINKSIEWFTTYFEGTEKLVELLKKHGLYGWEHYNGPPNIAFQQELLAIYREHGFDV